MTNKILASASNMSYGGQVGYPVPLGKSAVISKVVVYNGRQYGQPITVPNFKIYVVSNATSVTSVLFKGTLQELESFELTGGITLQEYDFIWVDLDFSYDGCPMDVTIFGAEL